MNEKYELAFSFAGENRSLVKKIALELKRRGVKVFYDELEKAELWGKDLYQYLAEIYSKKAKYCIIFISKLYVNKEWAKHELKNAQEKDLAQDKEYILPIRLDDTEVPGITDTIGYIDARNMTNKEIIEIILKKLDYPITKHVKDKDTTKKEKFKNEILYWKLISAINKFDPINFFPSKVPIEEYNVEVNAIIEKLDDVNSSQQLAHLMHNIFAKYFGLSIIGNISDYYQVAEEIWGILDTNGSNK